MSTLSIRLPNSLHKAAREAAKRDDTSINQLIVIALAEKLSAISTSDYFEERAARGSAKRFHELMAKVPHTDPEPYDRL
ncbi:MAG: type II toxin-antitoxin system HicB family antitoxin [Coriobacteriaceae bacterium]|jgi:hypothetical protein|nr:type II toxin-antitoxin system HicB family antitoxin [Coriobacteriaceae bacterium]